MTKIPEFDIIKLPPVFIFSCITTLECNFLENSMQHKSLQSKKKYQIFEVLFPLLLQACKMHIFCPDTCINLEIASSDLFQNIPIYIFRHANFAKKISFIKIVKILPIFWAFNSAFQTRPFTGNGCGIKCTPTTFGVLQASLASIVIFTRNRALIFRSSEQIPTNTTKTFEWNIAWRNTFR